MLTFCLLFLWICSVNSISFDSDEDFLIYPPLNLCHNGSFSFEFRTNKADGFLLYVDEQISSDFILVGISQGKLFVEMSLSKMLNKQSFDVSVDDDRWYKIVLKRRSSMITEINLYSVALRNVESRFFKTKILSYFPFNRSSMVIVGGLSNFSKIQSQFSIRTFRGSIRNLRYGHCGCPERIEHFLFSTIKRSFQSDVCQRKGSLCSSSSCECLNVDEEPRYQCDCSNKTCHLFSEFCFSFQRKNVRFVASLVDDRTKIKHFSRHMKLINEIYYIRS